MNWLSLLSVERFGKTHGQTSQSGEIRTEFQRDYDRIIFSSPFRRLQNKTQVFPLPGSVFVHNRLTHSLEVASVGRSLGNMVYDKISHKLSPEESLRVREMGTVVATACLAHDLGNPPFGHSGEKAISRFFAKNKGAELKEILSKAEYTDLIGFEGNANLLRLLTHQFYGRRKGGYSLTYASMGAMIKYPFDSLHFPDKKKYGFFQSEKESFEEIMDRLNIPLIDPERRVWARHPLVYLVEAADDICYQVVDLEDACKLNILSRERVQGLFREFFKDEPQRLEQIEQTCRDVSDANEQLAYLRALVIGTMVNAAAQVFVENYDDIMLGRFHSKIMKELPENLKKAHEKCAKVAFEEVYRHPSVVKVEISGYNVLGFLLEVFYEAVMNPQDDYSKKILSLLPSQYSVNAEVSAYEKAESVVDFVSGMTDVFAVDLFKSIRGLEL